MGLCSEGTFPFLRSGMRHTPFWGDGPSHLAIAPFPYGWITSPIILPQDNQRNMLTDWGIGVYQAYKYLGQEEKAKKGGFRQLKTRSRPYFIVRAELEIQSNAGLTGSYYKWKRTNRVASLSSSPKGKKSWTVTLTIPRQCYLLDGSHKLWSCAASIGWEEGEEVWVAEWCILIACQGKSFSKTLKTFHMHIFSVFLSL